MISTIETRLKLDTIQESEIDSCIALWSSSYRKAWKLFNNKKLTESEIHYYFINLKLLTSEQVKSIINKVKTEHAKIREITKTQLRKHQSKLDNINKFIIKEQKIIDNNKTKIISLKKAKTIDYIKISKITNSNKKKEFTVKQKLIKVSRLNKSIKILNNRIQTNTFKLCFGSSKLLSQKTGNHIDKFRLTKEQTKYKDLITWKKDWNLARNNIVYSIGSKDKPQGNREIQYYPKTKKLRLRVTEKEYLNRLELISEEVGLSIEDLNNNKIIKNGIHRMQARFIEINQVEFCAKNQYKVIQAINNKQPISAKMMKKLAPDGKDIGFYLQLSFAEVFNNNSNAKNTIEHNLNLVNQIIPNYINPVNLTMGIDLNQKGLAYCIITADGNKFNDKNISKENKPFGFISWDLNKKSTEQSQWIISNTITKVLDIAKNYNIKNIAIENLDFSSTISNMNSGYKSNQKYNKMLTQFAKLQFSNFIKRKTERLGMRLFLVNPAFSSIGGFAKYGLINRLPVDIAASLWLARQSLFGIEYKTEEHISFIKKHNEEVYLPFINLSKQSKKEIDKRLKWKDISLALGTNRNQWYKNIMKFINLEVDNSLSYQRFNPF